MVVCKYYQAGRCRYGENCKFEHVDPPHRSASSTSNDPFASSFPKHHTRNNKQSETQEPQWPLSAIGSADDLSKGNALSGDVSPEELRAMAYSMAPPFGVSPQVVQAEAQMVAEHRAKVDALSRGGMQTHAPAGSNTIQMRDPFAEHAPYSNTSRNGDAFQMAMDQETQRANANPFGSQPTSNAFGQNAAFSQPQANPFQHQNQNQPSLFAQQQSQTQPSAIPLAPPQFSLPSNVPISTPLAQNLTPGQQQQFSADQFSFANVPETAPPPQFQ